MFVHAELSSNQAREVLAAAGLPSEEVSVVLLKRQNDVYCLTTGSIVTYLKFYTKSWYGDDPARMAFNVEHEVYAYNTLKQAGLAVPDLVYGERSTDNPIGRPYLLLSALTGDHLLHVLTEPEATHAALEQAGNYLRRMHAIRFDYPGYLAYHDPDALPDPAAWQHRCWTAAARHREAAATLAAERTHLSPRVIAHLESIFDDMEARLQPAYDSPRFVHGDCHAHQVFLHGSGHLWRVMGVVDLEVASAGDPGEDLLKFCMEMMHAMPPWTRWWEPFFDGYGGAPDFDLLRLRLLGATEHEFRASGWPGPRDTLVSRLLVAQDWEDLFGF